MKVKKFKSFAEFKRLLSVGTKVHGILHVFHTRDENGKSIVCEKDYGIRKISIAQSNSFALTTVKTDGNVTDSWCHHPKASNVKIINDEKLQIFEGDKLILSYQILED